MLEDTLLQDIKGSLELRLLEINNTIESLESMYKELYGYIPKGKEDLEYLYRQRNIIQYDICVFDI